MRRHPATLRPTLLLALLLSSAVGLLVAPFVSSRRHAPSPTDNRAGVTPAAQVRETYGRIPLSFESNRGQTDSSVNFLARGAGYTLFLKPSEAVFTLRIADFGLPNEDRAAAPSSKTDAISSTVNPQSAIRNPQWKVLRMRLDGAASSAAAEGADELAGKVNYLVGRDPAGWRTDIPTYARVRFREVYPGVDVVYYGNQRQLEYDFVVAPGSDPRSVGLRFDGADKV